MALTIFTPKTEISETLSEQVSQTGGALVHDMQTAVRLARQLATESDAEVSATPPSPELQEYIRRTSPGFISDDLDYKMSQSAERPDVATVRLRGRIDNSLLGSIIGVGRLFYDTGFPLLHFDLADVADATSLDFLDHSNKLKRVWGTNWAHGPMLVAVTGYMHCQHLAICLLSGDQTRPERAGASWRFLLMDPNAFAARLPRISGQLLTSQWVNAIEAWEQRVSEGLTQDGPIRIDWSGPEGPLYVSSAEEQSCPTCHGPVWEGIRDRVLMRRTRATGIIPAATGASGCYSCPYCGSPVVVAFDGTVAHFDPPDQTRSTRQPQRPLPPLLPVSQK
jgi:hypothetical protein